MERRGHEVCTKVEIWVNRESLAGESSERRTGMKGVDETEEGATVEEEDVGDRWRVTA